MVEGMELGEMDWDTYKSDRKDQSVPTGVIVVNETANALDASTRHEIQAGFEEGRILAAAQNFTRSLVNEPGNVLTPTELARRAAAMCAEAGLECEVYSTAKLQELKMGAFLAVAQGSAEPPALIVMRYEPKEIAPGAPVFGLVGKGITFDTGGISLKPADGMEKMKYDMAGAAAMIGAMQAIAQLKPAARVIGVVCSAENMPDGRAFKPGDVVTAMSGKTIEIVNTDAEGRLVLADGLHYAKTLGCTHLINAATLTGACVVALGRINAGLFSNDDATCTKFQEGLALSGEKFWRMPCTGDYREEIKSQIADMMNTGATRYGGATSAAMFLAEFADETPWVHLDIAGCAWNEEQRPWLAKGPSGVGVRSIVEWVRSYSASAGPVGFCHLRERRADWCRGIQQEVKSGKEPGLKHRFFPAFALSLYREAEMQDSAATSPAELRCRDSRAHAPSRDAPPLRLRAEAPCGWDRSRAGCGGGGRSC